MSKSRIHKTPQRLLGLSQDELEKIREQFPYFQASRMLALKRDHAAGKTSEQDLSSASIYSHDRRELYDYLKKKKQADTPVEETQSVSDPVQEETQSFQTETILEEVAQTDTPLEETATEEILPQAEEAAIEPSDEQVLIQQEIEHIAETQLIAEPEEEESISEETPIDTPDLSPTEAYDDEELPEDDEPSMEPAPGENRRFIVADHTFDEWLDHFKKNKSSVKKTIEEIPQARMDAADELDRLIESSLPATYFHDKLESETQYAKGLENFIQTEKKKKAPAAKPADYSMVTETLAKIYERQGLVDKAIAAYEQLSLKNPEKSAYFAVHIERLKTK